MKYRTARKIIHRFTKHIKKWTNRARQGGCSVKTAIDHVELMSRNNRRALHRAYNRIDNVSLFSDEF